LTGDGRTLVALLAATACVAGCLGEERDSRPTHTLAEVRAALIAEELAVRPAEFAEQMAEWVVPESVRADEAGEHIVGHVVADENSLAIGKPSYLIVATVFDSPENADAALEVQRRWTVRTSRTAQFQTDNVVATFGGSQADALARLRAALAALGERS
jgi:hypothetical protein